MSTINTPEEAREQLQDYYEKQLAKEQELVEAQARCFIIILCAVAVVAFYMWVAGARG